MGGRYVLERDETFYWLERRDLRRLLAGRWRSAATRSCSWLAPVQPSKIMAIGLNYKDHAAEMNKKLPAEPLVFLKAGDAR